MWTGSITAGSSDGKHSSTNVSVATAPTSLTAVEVWADGGVQVEFVNDTHHLYDPAFAEDLAQLEAQVRILDSSLEGPPA